jgi:hypothetical protein
MKLLRHRTRKTIAKSMLRGRGGGAMMQTAIKKLINQLRHTFNMCHYQKLNILRRRRLLPSKSSSCKMTKTELQSFTDRRQATLVTINIMKDVKKEARWRNTLTNVDHAAQGLEKSKKNVH